MTTDSLAADFRNLLFLIWQHPNLPEPTNARYEIAGFMQHRYPDGYDPKIGRSVLARAWAKGCTFEEAAWAKGRKEQRIIDTLEPVMNTHRLIVYESVARDQTFVYQLTHITRERASLRHDDRVNSLAGAVSYFQRVLEMELEEMLEDFLETARSGSLAIRYKSRNKGTEVYQWRT